MKSKVILQRSLLLILGFLFAIHAGAQTLSISGSVLDSENEEPLPGATVVVQGTAFGTVTDIDGNFTMEVSQDAILLVSFIGYESKEIPLSGQASYTIELSPSTVEMEELVVIGYGKVKKSDATGSIQAISSKDFNRGAITSAQELLVGKSAGVVITTSGGAPGSGSTIRIRGGSSLRASNDPLIIVDGVPIDNSNVSGSANFLSFVNPNDIETMTILKDASATAIYGSRASNGVIIITTKSGAAGKKFSVSYNGNVSVAQAIKYVDVFSGDSLRAFAERNVDFFRQNNVDKLGTDSTDWQSEIFRKAISHDHNLSFGGVAGTIPYRASVGYTDQNGIMKNTDMQRITGSLNLNPTLLDDDLKVNINLKGMNTNNNFGDAGALGSAITMDPTRPVYDTIDDSGGYFQWSNYKAPLGTPNPVEQLMEVDNRSEINRVIGNIQLEYTMPFLPELRATFNIGSDYSTGKGHLMRDTTTNPNLTGEYFGQIRDYTATNTNSLLDFYLNYNSEIAADQNLDLTAGYSWQHFTREGRDSVRGFLPPTHSEYVKPDGSAFISENYLISFFGRANYSILSKYLFTATIRLDGSSRFAEGNRWGAFPSAAFAWKLNNEDFLSDIAYLSDLKLRLSWGITGQQDISGGDYPAQALYRSSHQGYYYPIGGEFIKTLRPDPYDPDIKWEETTTSNFGLDFGFVNDRISGAIDLYYRVTEDLIGEVTVASGSNFSNNLVTNVGRLENKGAEISLNLIPVSTPDINLTIGLNGTYNINTINKLLLTDDPNYLGIIYGDAFTGFKQVTRVGYPAYSFFVNKQVYDQDDNPIEGMYVDLSGEGGAVNGDNADKYIFQDPAPDFLFGLSARFSYKAFDLAASSRASIGNFVFDQVGAGASLDQMYQLNYWKNFPTILKETQFVKRQFTSDYWLYDASFFKLDNVSAGYTIDNIVDEMNLRVSFTVQNAVTITKYGGIDPEVQGGIDNNFYPRPRTFLLGLSLTY